MKASRPLALLFDLDGTLVDSVELILASMRHAFEGWPGRRPADADWLAGIGKPLRVQLAEFAATPVELERLVERYRTHQRANHDAMVRAFDGSVETVALLRARGHPVAVVTSKFHEPALRTLRHVGLAPHVDAVVAADTVARPKPDPEPVHAALRLLGRPAGEAVFVGDSPHDVAAGNAAGVATAAALWGACTRASLEPARPRYWLERIGDLPDLLERLGRTGETAAAGRDR